MWLVTVSNYVVVSDCNLAVGGIARESSTYMSHRQADNAVDGDR